MLIVLIYVLLPLFLSFITLFQNKKMMVVFSLFIMAFLSFLSVYMYVSEPVFEINLIHLLDDMIIGLDVLLLLYFSYIGAKYKSFTIGWA
jgi:lysylphosphatidylglycerol synthetase-like protein (DUF2156 family)